MLAPTGVWVWVCGGTEEVVAALFFGYAQGFEVAFNMPLVGASLLAKNSKTLRSSRMQALSLTFFASKLAPTGVWVCGGAEEFVAALFFGYAHGLEVAFNMPLVGASLLAKKLKTLRSSRMRALSLTFFASKLAPTGVWVWGVIRGRRLGRRIRSGFVFRVRPRP